jgi:hypothetical protein
VYISPKLQKELRAYIAAIPEREPSAALFYTQKHPRRGFTPTNAVLDQVVVAGRGSARSIFSDVVMGANQAKRSGQTAVAKIANIRN